MFWMIFLLTAKAAEEVSDVFTRRIGNRRNREFAQDLLIKKELAKYL
jgi:2-oxo-4-hydroxy-4-carboxy--5-ureidoimidazoline (OHCU) decarboxylase